MVQLASSSAHINLAFTLFGLPDTIFFLLLFLLLLLLLLEPCFLKLVMKFIKTRLQVLVNQTIGQFVRSQAKGPYGSIPQEII